ncbi:MAG TPA: hypothetical protein IAC03_03670 [Candidatus Coprenecus pullistercoris]|nr:hypothetical protein [Candidatus Coprenecus pullistercoris]
MKNLFSIVKISAMALATAAVVLSSCKKPDEEQASNAPTVTIEAVSQSVTSVTFSIASENAAELAYISVSDLSNLPSAQAVLTAGTKVEVPGGEVEITDLEAGATYYFAAAAVSSAGVYSEVATLEISTVGSDCTFEIKIPGITFNAVSYDVTPSDDTVPYYVAALPSSAYGEASDNEIYTAVIDSVIPAAADAAGISVDEFLAQGLFKGRHQDVIEGLSSGVEYVVTALGISEADGSLTTVVSTTKVVTSGGNGLELAIEVPEAEITAVSARVIVTPSDDNAKFYYQVVSEHNFPELSEEDGALAFAEAIVDINGQWFEQNIGLYTGRQDSPVSLDARTKYHVVAFGYTPGIGLDEASCEMYTFNTLEGELPEDFSGKIDIDNVTSRIINYYVRPDQESVYYQSLTIEKSAWEADQEGALDDICDLVYQANLDYYNGQISMNPSYTMQDAVSNVCYRGEQYLSSESNKPETEYIVIAISVNPDGTACRDAYITATVTTNSAAASNAVLTAELFGIFDGNEAIEHDLFGGSTACKDDALAVFQIHANEDVDTSQCYYFVWNGTNLVDDHDTIKNDLGEPIDTVLSWDDDWILSQIQTNPNLTKIAGEQVHDGYVFITDLGGWYDVSPYLGGNKTFLAVAKDKNGDWGPVYREKFSPKYAQVDKIQELIDLLTELGELSAKSAVLTSAGM